VICDVSFSIDDPGRMRPAAREYFSVDLRGLRAALATRAAEQGMTESDVLRSALAAALRNDECRAESTTSNASQHPPATLQVKLSVRLPRQVAQRLDHNARAAGLSRGAYLSRLIDGAPPVLASPDRAAGFAALSASATELAVLSRDINHLTKLLRAGSVEAARQYTKRLETLDGDVRAHLTLAAATLAELASARRGPSRQQRTTSTHPWSAP
jgi:hypothetical protein